MLRRFVLFFLLAACASPAYADVKLHGLFTDHMVLQQRTSVPVWGMADPNEKVSVRFQNQGFTVQAGTDGKWMGHLRNLQPGGPFEMEVEGKNKLKLNDVLVGEVWICSGQSNMQWAVSQSKDSKDEIANSANNQLRLFQHKMVTSGKPLDTVQTDKAWNQWRVSGPDSVPGFTAVGYHFGKALQKARNVPVGLIQTAWGGTPAEAWTSIEFLEKTPELVHYVESVKKQVANFDETMKKYNEQMEQYNTQVQKLKEEAAKNNAPAAKTPPAPRRPAHPDQSPNSPARLYNAMIQPLVPFAVKGAIWYQGESNAGRAYEYRTLFPTMIQSWRKAWGYEFPFLFVQLAPFMKIADQPRESDWAELREAQLLTSQRLHGTAQAVITDTTDAATDQTDIHPKNKAPVGQRLALAALQNVYGECIVGSGPVYHGAQFQSAGTRSYHSGIGKRRQYWSVDVPAQAVLHFTSTGSGLMAKGEKLTGFTIAGPDKKFYPADAVIEGNRVIVSSSSVQEPVAVRFGWADYPVVNLFNREGIPASPFRTDDWPGKTWPKAK